MNTNIFSCTVPPLLVFETQIIHHEPLQSLRINPCVPLAAIFFVDLCTRVEAPAAAHRCLRAGAPVSARPRPAWIVREKFPQRVLRLFLTILSF